MMMTIMMMVVVIVVVLCFVADILLLFSSRGDCVVDKTLKYNSGQFLFSFFGRSLIIFVY